MKNVFNVNLKQHQLNQVEHLTLDLNRKFNNKCVIHYNTKVEHLSHIRNIVGLNATPTDHSYHINGICTLVLEDSNMS